MRRQKMMRLLSTCFFFFCKRLLSLPKLIFTQREQRSPEDTRVRRGRREWTKTMMGSEERTLTPSRDSPSWVSYGPDHVALLPAHYRWGRGRRRSRERRLRVKPTDLIHSLLIGRRAAFSFSRTCKGGGFSHEAFLALSLSICCILDFSLMTSQWGQIPRVSVKECKRGENRSWGANGGERRGAGKERAHRKKMKRRLEMCCTGKKKKKVCNRGRKREGREVNRQAVMQQLRFRWRLRE